MSHTEYVNNINDIDQLAHIAEITLEKIQRIKQEAKTEYLVLCDDWSNTAFFNRDDTEKALDYFCKVFKQQAGKQSFDNLRIEVQRHRASEYGDLVE